MVLDGKGVLVVNCSVVVVSVGIVLGGNDVLLVCSWVDVSVGIVFGGKGVLLVCS
jgi:hypothetical protein